MQALKQLNIRQVFCTGLSAMKRMQWVGALSGATFVLIGCGQEYRLHEVDGVDVKFCVPDVYVVPNIPWMPPDPVGVPKGFAFGGCWRGDFVAPPECVLPNVVQGGVVEPLSSYASERWQDLDSDSPYKSIATTGDSLIEGQDSGTIVIVSNARVDWRWYVWRKAKPLAVGEMPHLEADDELIATCQITEVALPSKGETRKTNFCDRYVRGKEYVLKYTFESSERTPHQIEKLDTKVITQIDRWRCEKIK